MTVTMEIFSYITYCIGFLSLGKCRNNNVSSYNTIARCGNTKVYQSFGFLALDDTAWRWAGRESLGITEKSPSRSEQSRTGITSRQKPKLENSWISNSGSKPSWMPRGGNMKSTRSFPCSVYIVKFPQESRLLNSCLH